jgi:hypothetical protein
MTTSVEVAGSSERHEVIITREEIASYVAFWRGEQEHFASVIGEGIEYIKALHRASQMPFASYIDTPQGQLLTEEATATLEEVSRRGLDDIKGWLKSNPDKISVLQDGGKLVWVSDAALVEYDPYPFVEGQVLTGPLDVHWVDEGTEQ